jgi:hypothetical protein
MVFVLFSVSGLPVAPEPFVAKHQLLEAKCWRKGEPSRSGKPPESSGFAFSLPDSPNWPAAQPSVQALLDTRSSMFRELREIGATTELSIGVTVGSEESFVSSLEFAPQLLSALATHHVTLTVNAYPTSDAV